MVPKNFRSLTEFSWFASSFLQKNFRWTVMSVLTVEVCVIRGNSPANESSAVPKQRRRRRPKRCKYMNFFALSYRECFHSDTVFKKSCCSDLIDNKLVILSCFRLSNLSACRCFRFAMNPVFSA